MVVVVARRVVRAAAARLVRALEQQAVPPLLVLPGRAQPPQLALEAGVVLAQTSYSLDSRRGQLRSLQRPSQTLPDPPY